MSYDTFDTTVISSTKTEAHNLDTINASAAANIHADTAEISQFLKSVVWHLLLRLVLGGNFGRWLEGYFALLQNVPSNALLWSTWMMVYPYNIIWREKVNVVSQTCLEVTVLSILNGESWTDEYQCIIRLKGPNFAYFTIHLWEPLNNRNWISVGNGNLTMFGVFHCFPTENERKPRGKDFQKKELERGSRRGKRGTGEQTSFHRSNCLYLVVWQVTVN